MLILRKDFKGMALSSTENFGVLLLLMRLLNWPNVVTSARKHKLKEAGEGACWAILL